MSQYPPQPPQQPPYGQPPTPPPYGQPGMPQYGMPGTPAPRAGTSGAAIASLICGILGCIPLITSLLAVILGILGIKATSNGRAGGRGMAIAGLILGLLGLAGWSVGGGAMVWGWSQAKKQIALQAKPCLDAIYAGDYTKAQNYSTMSTEKMTELHQEMQPWGPITDMSMSGFNTQKNVGRPGTLTINGAATFAQGGSKPVEIDMDTSSGTMKVSDVQFK